MHRNASAQLIEFVPKLNFRSKQFNLSQMSIDRFFACTFLQGSWVMIFWLIFSFVVNNTYAIFFRWGASKRRKSFNLVPENKTNRYIGAESSLNYNVIIIQLNISWKEFFQERSIWFDRKKYVFFSFRADVY